jgi:hypothetical protein
MRTQQGKAKGNPHSALHSKAKISKAHNRIYDAVCVYSREATMTKFWAQGDSDSSSDSEPLDDNHGAKVHGYERDYDIEDKGKKKKTIPRWMKKAIPRWTTPTLCGLESKKPKCF